MEKLAISVDEMAKLIGCSRPVAYQIANRDDFPALRVGKSGKKIIIPIDGLKRWLSEQSREVRYINVCK